MEEILSKPIRNHDNDFTMIKKGCKVYEGRLKSKIQDWNLYIGKKIHFYDEDRPSDGLIVEITKLRIFDTFAQAFDILGFNLKPNRTRQRVINSYNQLFHYEDETLYDGITSRMITEQGVVAIGFKIIY